MHHDLLFPRRWVVLSLAVAGGVAGAGVGLAVAVWRQGGPLGAPDPTRLLIDNTWALAWAALAGGAGWCVTSFLAWGVRNTSAPPTTTTSVALRIVAVGVAVAGVALTRVISSTAADGSDTHIGYDVSPLTLVVFVDAMLVASTLLLLSRRGRTTRFVIVTAATVAALALLASALSVASLPRPTERWLEYWLATRQAPLGAAPNLLMGATERCPARAPDPYPGDDRSFDSDVPPVYYWINPFAPRWLPEGFGLERGRSWPWPQPHAVWTDARCREVSLIAVPGRGGRLEIDHGPPEVAGWSLTSPNWCSEPRECREYVVRATIRGSDAATTLVLRTVGVPQDEADKIARSIPTDRAAYI